MVEQKYLKMAKSNKPDLLITHDGVFHADEVIGIALVQHYFCSRIPVTRTRDAGTIAKFKKDKSVWLIDVGEELNEEMGNLDHHHDRSLLGATIHVANKLWSTVPEKFQSLVTTVSRWDVNDGRIHEVTEQGGCISQFFKMLNNYGTFEEALEFADKLLKAIDHVHAPDHIFSVADGYIVEGLQARWEHMLAEDARKEMQWYNMYERECKRIPVRAGEVLILPEFFPWQRFAKAENERQDAPVQIIGAIFYDSRAYNWRLSSIDSERYPISQGVEEIEGFVFVHPARFIAGFETEEASKKAAELW